MRFTNVIRQYKTELLTDKTVYETEYTNVIEASRFQEMHLFVDATEVVTDAEVEFNEVQAGQAGVHNTWVLNVGSADGGTFDIGIEGDMQTSIAHDANATAIQTELRKITGDGWDEVTVAGTTPGDFTITMPFKLGAVTLVADFDSLTEGGVALTTPASLDEGDEYSRGKDTVHTYEVKRADGGTWDIESGDFTNIATLAHDVSADDLKSAFVGADADFIDDEGEVGHVDVSLDDGVYTVTFTAYALDGDNISTDVSGLTQTTLSLQVEVETEQPFNANKFYTVRDSTPAHFFSAITGTGAHDAVIPLTAGKYRLKYTVSGVDKAAKLKVSAVMK